jgi:hypothetical protein
MKTAILFFIGVVEAMVSYSQVENCNACAGGSTNTGGGGCSTVQMSGNHLPPENNAPWELIFQEEFNSPTLDYNNVWESAISDCGPPPNAITCIQRDNLQISNGIANLQTLYEANSLCNWVIWDPLQTGTSYLNYTVPNIAPIQKFGPGKFEIRAKIPVISGQWAAFWLYNHTPGDPDMGNEIDMFEIKQDEPDVNTNCGPACDNPPYALPEDAGRRMIMTSHSKLTPNGTQCAPQKCYIHNTPLSDDFHVYTLIWDEDYIQWILDGNLLYTRKRLEYLPSTNVTTKEVNFPHPDLPMSLFLSTSIWSEHLVNSLNEEGAYTCSPPLTPNDFLIDYVRVWKKECGTGFRELCYDTDPFVFHDPNNAIVKAATIHMASSCLKWVVHNGQKLKLGATDEIKLVDFEARLGSEFVATITRCEELDYRNNPLYTQEVSSNQSDILKESETIKTITVQPNPNNGEFRLEIQSSKNDITQLEMIDITGTIHYSESIDLLEGNNSISISRLDLSPGMYFIRVNGIIETIKILITK